MSFEKIKLQHKMAPGMYQHQMFNVSDIVLVTDKGEEMPLKDFLARLEKFAQVLSEHELKLKVKEDEDPFERSGAV